MVLIGIQFSSGIIYGSPLWVSLEITPWLAPSEVLLGGWLFWIFLLGSSIPTCTHLLVWLVGLLVLDSVVHKLNHVRHDNLHIRKTYLACWIVLERLYCVIYSIRSCLGDVCIMASIVFHLWYDVPAVFSMWFLWCTFIWNIMNY